MNKSVELPLVDAGLCFEGLSRTGMKRDVKYKAKARDDVAWCCAPNAMKEILINHSHESDIKYQWGCTV